VALGGTFADAQCFFSGRRQEFRNGGATFHFRVRRRGVLGTLWIGPTLVAVLRTLKRRSQSSAIVAVGSDPWGWLVVLLVGAVDPSVVRVIEIHGELLHLDPLILGRMNALILRAATILAARRADAVRVVAEPIRTALAEIDIPSELIPSRIQRIWEAPATPKRPPSPGEPLQLLAVGRLNRWKGFDLLLDALANARACFLGPRFHLRIAGEGPERNSLVAQIAQLGLQDRVEMLGSKSEDELRAEVLSAHCIVISSRSEGLPRVALEAISCCRTLIATDVGGIRYGLRSLRTPTFVVPDAAAIMNALLKLPTSWPSDADLIADRASVLTRFGFEKNIDELSTWLHLVERGPKQSNNFEKLLHSAISPFRNRR
jgi:glycosyltransferase involved in cell wall biosynthesis